LAAPDSGPRAGYALVHAKYPNRSDGCHAVPLNLLNRQGEKASAEEKDYDSGFGRVAFCNTRCPDPFARGRKFPHPSTPHAKLRPPAVESVPAVRKCTPVNSDNEDQEDMMEDQKRLLKHGKGKGSRGPKTVTRPTKEQESSHPMNTRGKASRAGGLRQVGGSGQTDTCVANGNPSKT
jgi:hypothetical protein